MVADGVGLQLLAALKDVMHEKLLASDEVLISERGPSDALYVVAGGELAITVEDGRELGRCGPGALVGEVSFLDRAPASATVTATAGTRVWELQRTAFDALVRTKPDVASEVLRMLCTQLSTRIRTASDRMDVLSQQPAQAPEARPTLLAALRSLFFGEP